MIDGVVWEERWHPLREEWVLFTSHRGGRPWLGETKKVPDEIVPAYDPTCALCPGNRRLKGHNPNYQGVFWFTNDLPCFGAASEVPKHSVGTSSRASVHDSGEEPSLYLQRPPLGTAEVLCYHPDHNRTFADLSVDEALRVVELWTERYQSLGRVDYINHILIFENQGMLVGTSNPHPHCQLYASGMVYGTTEKEDRSARSYFERTGRLLGPAICDNEAASARVVCENLEFIACVPFFARYAYEVLILPRRPATSLADLDDVQRRCLSAIMVEVTIRYDNLWQMRMPYVMAVHQAPTDGLNHHTYPFHIEYHPPLRKPDTLKYLAGPEIGGGSMTNESDPEEKAAELRAASGGLYRAKTSGPG